MYLPAWAFGRPLDIGGRASTPLATRLEPVPHDIASALQIEGLRPAPVYGLRVRLDPVENLLDRVPDLARIVSITVRSIHPLMAEPGYDVSHSQPKWRDRIFVSFPERQDEIGQLRLTEGVVHETMHLHLTNEEARIAFIARSTDTLYSPWMDTVRPVRGVLHGLFVFCCIWAFLSRVAENGPLTADARRYVRTRLAEIWSEISLIDTAALESALTPYGLNQTRLWKSGLRSDRYPL